MKPHLKALEEAGVLSAEEVTGRLAEVVTLPVADPVQAMYQRVRDATVCNEAGASNADKVAVLELVKAELLRNLLNEIDPE